MISYLDVILIFDIIRVKIKPMLRTLFVFVSLALSACSESEIKNKGDKFGACHKADEIFEKHPTVPTELNNGASDIEICLSSGGLRRIRHVLKETILTEIIEPAPIHVRERAFICDKYFLLSDGSDSENVLGHYFDNTVYRISDGQKMTSFSSEDLLVKDCSIFNN